MLCVKWILQRTLLWPPSHGKVSRIYCRHCQQLTTGPAGCSGFPPETLWWIAGLCKYKHTSHWQLYMDHLMVKIFLWVFSFKYCNSKKETVKPNYLELNGGQKHPSKYMLLLLCSRYPRTQVIKDKIHKKTVGRTSNSLLHSHNIQDINDKWDIKVQQYM